MDKNIKASEFIRKVNYFYDCYIVNLRFGLLNFMNIYDIKGSKINYVKFNKNKDFITNVDIVSFSVYSNNDDNIPYLTITTEYEIDEDVYVIIVKGLEEYLLKM